ncbi:Putrescine importer PuuP, partial [Pseudomonas syringae]
MHTTTSTAHSPSHDTAAHPGANTGRFRKSMGLTALVLFGLAYMVPLA